jgi:hypothetical protein
MHDVWAIGRTTNFASYSGFEQRADPTYRPKKRRRASRRPAVLPTSSSMSLPYLRSLVQHSLTTTRVAETLSDEVLQKMYAPPKPTDIKTLEDPSDLDPYDAFLFGIPTRYGTMDPGMRCH